MNFGAIIEKGPVDWQIIQHASGYASFDLAGTYEFYVAPSEESKKEEDGKEEVEKPKYAKVHVRVVKEDSGDPIIQWESCKTENGNWEHTVKGLPVGGLYRIETCLEQAEGTPIEWCIRGDVIHHIGVGDLFLITGQSNSAGYGKNPVFDPPELGVHMLKNSGKWDMASHPMNESTRTIHEINREPCNSGHSPYLAFAKMLKRELGYPIGLIQAALGGSCLSSWNPAEDGCLYRNMLECAKLAGGKLAGILWYQGCSDSAQGTCDTYLERFKNMVTTFRAEIDDKKLPFFTVQLNRYIVPAKEGEDIYWGKVREAQRQSPKHIENVYVISSLDCGLSDSIHNSAASNMIIGERLAKMVLCKIHGKKYICNSPDISYAKIDEEKIVSLHFDNIHGRIFTMELSVKDLPFYVEDESGNVELDSYSVVGANIIKLVLKRRIQGKGVVHGAYQMNPAYIVPVDISGYLPMLAFYGVAIIE